MLIKQIITIVVILLSLMAILLIPTEKVTYVSFVFAEQERTTISGHALQVEIKRLANKYSVSESLAKAIIFCESSNNINAINENYSNNIIWSKDYGPWQVNDYFHADRAKALGYDVINNWKDNLEYGFILLKTDGPIRHWSASASCWGKKI